MPKPNQSGLCENAKPTSGRGRLSRAAPNLQRTFSKERSFSCAAKTSKTLPTIDSGKGTAFSRADQHKKEEGFSPRGPYSAATTGVELSTLIVFPGCKVRKILYGPVTISSPSFNPSKTSVSLVPLIPVFTGTNSTLRFRTTNTP